MSQFPVHFDPDASYLLVGGLGGLGRSIAQWMADHGAKNLIFISRSGLKKPEAELLVDKLGKRDVKTAVYACDVSDREAMRKALYDCNRRMPRIRGAIQGAMILEDSLFERMTVDQFHAALRPKVQGSWNLHELLPLDLDFFTMLSSSAGIIGSRGQGNYAAGNTYEDALAAYRRGKGLAASTIDLGLILGVGYVAENPQALENIQRWGFVGIPEPEFLRILRGAIASSKPLHAVSSTGQFTTGIGYGGVIHSNHGGEFPYYFIDARFSHLRDLDVKSAVAGRNDTKNNNAQSLYTLLEKAGDIGEAQNLISVSFLSKVSKLLLIPLEDISSSKALHEYGVDSLVAVEIRNWIFREVRTTVSVFDILSNSSISALCTKIALGCPGLKRE